MVILIIDTYYRFFQNQKRIIRKYKKENAVPNNYLFSLCIPNIYVNIYIKPNKFKLNYRLNQIK